MRKERTEAKQIAKMYEEEAKRFEKAAAEAKPVCYRGYSGITYEETPGTYNRHIARSMASDVYTIYVWAHGKYNDKEIDDLLLSIYARMKECNEELMRMVNDFNTSRPVNHFFTEDKVEKMSKDVVLLEQSGILKGFGDKDIKRKIGMWLSRLMYQVTWEYIIQQYITINIQIAAVADHTEKHRFVVEQLCLFRRRLLRAALRIPVSSRLHDRCIDMIEHMDMLTNVVINA